jgi:GT2 family glycosyltransferase
LKIAVAILNWNGLELLQTFLPSVVMHSKDANVYVIDNNSSDKSIEYISENYPKVKIIKNESNSGYAGGYNQGLKKLNEDIFILLNNDVEVTKDWLVPIRKIFETEPQVAVVQPKLLDYKNKAYFEYAGAAGGFLDRFGYPYCRGRIFDTVEKDIGQYDEDSNIFWASGASLAIRKDVFYKVGALDENYFAHQEEIDLCWRVLNSGFLVKYAKDSVVYHKGGSTLSAYNPQKTFLNFRNSLYNLIKNVKPPVSFLLVFIRLILDGVAGLKFLISGQFRHFFAILKAHVSFYVNFGAVFKKRSKDFKIRKYSNINSIVFQYYILKQKVYRSDKKPL